MKVTTGRRERYLNGISFFQTMQKKLLFDLIEDLAGEGTGRIVEVLYEKKDVNEFSISKQMDLTVNQVRNILYKLSNYGLVSFIRKKDKRKGWYIYYWTLNTEKSFELIENYLEKKIKELEEDLNKRENDRYYVCPSCGIEVKESTALEQDFVCDECAEIFELADNSPYIRDLKSKITRNDKLLEQIKEELLIVRSKNKAKRDRAAKKAEKEKEAEKESKKKPTATKKTTVKKVPVKKTATKKVPVKKTVTKKSTTKKKEPVKKKTTTIKKAPVKKVTKKSPSKTSSNTQKGTKKSAAKKPTKKKK